MNILPFDKQISAIAALTEGCSIRATERLTDIHRDTIMRLGVRVGEGCAALHDRMMRDLQVPILEFDEIWGYVGKKQRRITRGETDKGDQYTFIASRRHQQGDHLPRHRQAQRRHNADIRQRCLGAGRQPPANHD